MFTLKATVFGVVAEALPAMSAPNNPAARRETKRVATEQCSGTTRQETRPDSPAGREPEGDHVAALDAVVGAARASPLLFRRR
jgi:hypothetical protein